MRLTVSSHSFEWLPLEGTLAVAKALGFTGVDIAGFHNRAKCSLEPDAVGAEPERYADHLNGLLDRYGLQAVDFFPQFGTQLHERSLNDPDPAVRQHNAESLRGIIRFCQLAGIPGFTMSPGIHHLGRSLEQNLDASGHELQWLTAMAGEHGVTVRFEPHMLSVADTPERALSLLERAPQATVTLDYSHFLLQYIPVERCHALLPHTDHVHVRQARPGKLQTRTEEGTLDFVDIAHRLKAQHYQRCLSIEYVCIPWYDCNQVDCITETVFTKAILEPHVSVG